MVKNLPLKLQSYSGVAGVFALWVLILLAMHKAQLGLIDNRPISYLGVDPKTKLLFMLGLIISAILFISFAYYINRRFKVGRKFMAYFLIGQLGQIVAALFPDTPHSCYKIIHTIAAFTLAFSLPLLIRQFSLSQPRSQYHKLYVSLFRFELVAFVIGIGMFILVKGVAPLGEALPTIGFDLWIIVLTYLTLKIGAFALQGA